MAKSRHWHRQDATCRAMAGSYRPLLSALLFRSLIALAGINALASLGASAADMQTADSSSATAANANTRRHLTVALPEGLSPRTVGYYLADSEGYFRDRGVTVDFISSPGQSPSRLLVDGKADLAVELMPVALQLHQAGEPLQLVAQFFQHSTLALYCRPPIAKPADLHGTTIGVWFGGEESAFYAWMSQLNISTFGEEDGVTVLRQNRSSGALTDPRLDCATSTSYIAPRQMQAAGIAAAGRAVFRYDDLGVGTLEDGLYARAKDLADDTRVDLYSRFLAASIRGWQKLHDDRATALRQFRDADKDSQRDHTGAAPAATTGDDAPANAKASSRNAQKAASTKPGTDKPVADKPADIAAGGPAWTAALKASLDAVDAAIDPSHYKIGLLDPGGYDRTVNLLLTGAPDPVLRGAPVAAVNDALWKRLHLTPSAPKQ
ncbi:MAG TPA: ABC transporter substrate-binding protein [Dongiaceae bacterium]|nr:ABC transporter substrate-binding protein [Dongiaceae bacterium]